MFIYLLFFFFNNIYVCWLFLVFVLLNGRVSLTFKLSPQIVRNAYI